MRSLIFATAALATGSALAHHGQEGEAVEPGGWMGIAVLGVVAAVAIWAGRRFRSGKNRNGQSSPKPSDDAALRGQKR